MDLPIRKLQRLHYYDYAAPGYYFITICTHQKKQLLSHISADMQTATVRNQLTAYGRAALDELGKLSERYSNVHVDKAVIMPNHIHAILIIEQSPAPKSLSEIVGAYKSLTVRQCRKLGFTEKLFQVSFHDHIIRSRTDYEKIWLYIHSNPQNWKKDCFFE